MITELIAEIDAMAKAANIAVLEQQQKAIKKGITVADGLIAIAQYSLVHIGHLPRLRSLRADLMEELAVVEHEIIALRLSHS